MQTYARTYVYAPFGKLAFTKRATTRTEDTRAAACLVARVHVRARESAILIVTTGKVNNYYNCPV